MTADTPVNSFPDPPQLRAAVLLSAPVWIAYAALVFATSDAGWPGAIAIALRACLVGGTLGAAVWLIARRVRFPASATARFAALQTMLALAFGVSWVVLVEMTEAALRLESPLWPYWRAPFFIPRVVMGVWLYLAIAGTFYALQSTRRYHAERERAARAEADRVLAHLAVLRAQVRPHFLYNALNSVSVLIRDDPVRAEGAVHALARLLQASFEHDGDRTSVAREMELVADYLRLAELRFEDRLTTDVRIDERVRECEVPAFSVQGLVDNAVRHGVAPNPAPTHIAIEVERRDDRLRISVSDDGVGATPDLLTRGGGVGLVGLRSRLDAEYGQAGSVEVDTAPGRGLTATITLPAAERSVAR